MIREASLEVRGPVIYATAVVIAVFLPEIFTTSVQGHFVGPLALAFIFAVLASLLVAMTATPALCALLLRRHDARPESRWLRRLKVWQSPAVHGVAAHFKVVVAVLIVCVVAAAAALPFLGGTFMPDFREGHFVIQVSSSIPGTSLDEMLDVGKRISAEILALPYVASVEQQVGRAELGEDTWGPHRSEFHVELKADAEVDQGAAQDDLRGILEHYPGLQSEVVTFLGDRISESLSGETAQVAVKVFGDDLDALDATGDKIVAVLGKIPGIVDLQFKRQSGTPAIAIQLVPAALVASGLKAQDVLDTIEESYTGAMVGQTFSGTRTVDVVVLLPDALRHQPERLSQLMISGPLGPVPLSQVARIVVSQDRYSIEHDGGQRRISVTFNVSGASLQSVVQQASQAIAAKVALPSGVYTEFTGAAEAEQQTRTELMLYSGLALALIIMILFIAFHWRANSWLVLANLPFALIGSVAAIAADRHRHLAGHRGGSGDRIRRECPQCDTAAGALRASGGGRGRAVEHRRRHARRQRALGAHSDDGRRDRARACAAGLRHESAGPGNRRTDGGHRAGRIAVLDPAESVRAAGARATLRETADAGRAQAVT